MTRAVQLTRWVALVLGAVVTIWLSVGTIVGSPEPLDAVVALAILAPALVVLLRRDWHVVGWLLLATAAISAAQFAESLPLTSVEWQGWIFMVLNVAFWAVMAVLVAVFPDGLRRQQGVPRFVDRAVVVIVSLATVMAALTRDVEASGWNSPAAPTRFDNPLGFGWLSADAYGLLQILALLGLIIATCTLVARSRRATGVVRQQYLWVLFPFGYLIVAVPVAVIISDVRGQTGAEWFGAVLGYIAIPICFGVAITRYRLYDIGRIISRTVTYTFLVAVLGAIFFGLVTLATTLLPTQNALAVAGSTLAVAAAFNPLRIRIQHAVDRRFNRSAYEAEVISEEFTSKLHQSLTVDQLTQLWTSTIIDFLQPETSAVWLSTKPAEIHRP